MFCSWRKKNFFPLHLVVFISCSWRTSWTPKPENSPASQKGRKWYSGHVPQKVCLLVMKLPHLPFNFAASQSFKLPYVILSIVGSGTVMTIPCPNFCIPVSSGLCWFQHLLPYLASKTAKLCKKNFSHLLRICPPQKKTPIKFKEMITLY